MEGLIQTNNFVNYQFHVLGKGVTVGGNRLDSISVRNPETRFRIPEYDGREACASISLVYCYA